MHARRRYTPEQLRERTLALRSSVDQRTACVLEKMADDPVMQSLGIAAYDDCHMPAFLFQVSSYISSMIDGDPFSQISEAMHTEHGYHALRAFFIEYDTTIRHLLSTRRIQTHHLERCGPMFPAFCLAARQLKAKQVGIVDIGTAGGLHLFWDQYAYDYASLGTFGNSTSAVRCQWQWRGTVPKNPQEFLTAPKVASRVGIDLAPIDLRSEEGRRWSAAFEGTSGQALEDALNIADRNAHTIVAGDCIEQLPTVLARMPGEVTPLVMHCFTALQFSPTTRQALETILLEAGRARPLARVSLDSDLDSQAPATVEISRYTSVGKQTQTVARGEHPLSICDWFEWIGPTE